MTVINTPWMRAFLDAYFPDTFIHSTDVETIDMHAHLMNWPKSMYCACERCRSPWVQQVALGQTITVRTKNGETYTAYRPNPDPDIWKHGTEQEEHEEREWKEEGV